MVGVSQVRGAQIRASSVFAMSLLAVAAISLSFFSAGIASGVFLLAALMSWSRPFEANRAKGKPTLSDTARGAVVITLTAVGALFLWHPNIMDVGVEPEKGFSLTESDAFAACEAAARQQITHPSTADFSVLDANLQSHDDGTALFTTTFTARNSFNLKLTYRLVCDFTGDEMTGTYIFEDQ